ncbi:hypothetical protein V2J09_014306 [Rumex salicifolius]
MLSLTEERNREEGGERKDNFERFGLEEAIWWGTYYRRGPRRLDPVKLAPQRRSQRHMAGQMQQSNAAAAAMYDHPSGAPLYNAGPAGNANDAVMARWLQSAGLQHLASPMASNNMPNNMPNLLMQGYGAQSAEEKQKLFKLMRNLNFNGESGSEPYTPTAQSTTMDGFYSPEFRGDFGAGLLDLHAMDDTELLSEHVISEPFEPSPFMPGPIQTVDDDSNMFTRKQHREQDPTDTDTSILVPMSENVSIPKESNVAKIKVVVRKRPLNKKELTRKEDDVVTVSDNSLTVHEPKVKVDLTAYVEKHEFCFDAVLDEDVSNNEVYRETVQPIIPIIFQRTKATCFAYGQTGSGKTFTMKPLPLRAADDLVRYLQQPIYRNQKLKLWLSYFEIYGGKLYDLLCERKKLCMREDGRQQVCIVGLQEFEVSDVQIVKEYIEKGNASRSTGSTGANEESSRSHAILQLVVKKHNEVKENKRNNDANEASRGKVVGKISFIDLAGSERGADTTDNDRQTRIEGAEINKSLLALKECIRALDNDQIHIPFRGSKLTEVLRDSFVGNSRTVMISCISPGSGSCEHTLNTLRYADRVKSLSKNGNAKKEVSSSIPLVNRDTPSIPSVPASFETEDVEEKYSDAKVPENNRKAAARDSDADYDQQPSVFRPAYNLNGPSNIPTSSADTPSIGGSTSQKYSSYSRSSADTEERVQNVPSQKQSSYNRSFVDAEERVQNVPSQKQTSYNRSSVDTEERVQNVPSQKQSSHNRSSVDAEERVPNVSPPRRKVSSRDEQTEKLGNWLKKESGGSDLPKAASKLQSSSSSTTNTVPSRRRETETTTDDGNIDALLEEEEALITAHRKEIEDTMEIVREEMKLLAEVDQPGSLIDNYVTQLSFVLSRKAAGLVSLQARLARFQHRLKEQEILSRKRVPR